jgi:hypothetical protein
MAILANRYWILLAFTAAAVVSYSVGFKFGLGLFVAAGLIFDLVVSFDFGRRFLRHRREAALVATSSWRCQNCQEESPEEFAACWNCGTPKPGSIGVGPA